MEGAKATDGFRRSKKKQAKSELDRIKLAEKKKRRLEKALANSAAIRVELEKKKQRKKEEEQERLEEEGAAIAEAAALHVLIDEDLSYSSGTVLNGYMGLSSWGSMIPHQNWSEYSRGLRAGDSYRFGQQPWNCWGNSNSRDLLYRPRYVGHGGSESAVFSAAVQCFSALNIADDVARRGDGCVFNRMLRG